MSLIPFLLVGIGGSGGKTLRYVKKALQDTLTQAGYDGPFPQGWQFLHFDTPATQDGVSFPRPMLKPSEYFSTVPAGATYSAIDINLKEKVPSEYRADVMRPLPYAPDVSVSGFVYWRTGPFRGLGKAVALESLSAIRNAASAALSKLNGADVQPELDAIEQKLGTTHTALGRIFRPQVVFITSIGGGTGSGHYMEVVECVKAAIGNSSSALHTMSILFTPDTFQSLGAAGNLIPANSLFSLTEIMNGIWSRESSKPIQELYKQAGIPPKADVVSRVGAAYNFVIGRYSLNGLDLGGQDQTYMAAGEFLKALMANPAFQDSFMVRPIGDWQSKSLLATDSSGIHLQGTTPTPFRSVGFGKVSLGLDMFREFAAERLARSTVESILYKHLSADPEQTTMSDSQWVTKNADQEEANFFGASKLIHPWNDETNYDIITGISPGTGATIAASLGEAIRSTAGGTSKNPIEWATFIDQQYQNTKFPIIGRYRDDLNAKVRSWVAGIQDHLIKEVRRSIADHGLPVTCELLRRLQEKLNDLVGTFGDYSNSLRQRFDGLGNAVMNKLPGVIKMRGLAVTHGVVRLAIETSEEYLTYEMSAELWEAGAKLAKDIGENFIDPLLRSLEIATTALSHGLASPNLPNGSLNPWGTWTDFSNQYTPMRFAPAVNVELLIDPGDYPRLFARLLGAHLELHVNEGRAAIKEIAIGSDSLEFVTPGKSKEWAPLDFASRWVPTEAEYQIAGEIATGAQFKVMGSHMDYLEACEKWLDLPGRPFHAFLHQSLSDYLQAGGNAELQQERQGAFVAQFQTALKKCAPLVQIDQSVHTAIHAINPSSIPVFSPIPVDEQSPLGQQLSQAVTNAFPTWDSKPKFVGSASAESEVFITSYIEYPFSPVAMTSIMRPISQQWLAAQNDPVSRIGFLQWKRGRPLPDSLPVSKDIRKWMIQGWHIAKFLNMLDIKVNADSMGNSKVSIWHGPNLGFVSFPFPFMVASQPEKEDLLAAALISLEAAFIEVFNQQSLMPMEPYKKLRSLAEKSALSNWRNRELGVWVDSGELLDNQQPRPDSAIAGAASDSSEQRAERARAFFKRELQDFNQLMGKVDPYGDLREYPDIWELRHEVSDALDELIGNLSSNRAEDRPNISESTLPTSEASTPAVQAPFPETIEDYQRILRKPGASGQHDGQQVTKSIGGAAESATESSDSKPRIAKEAVTQVGPVSSRQFKAFGQGLTWFYFVSLFFTRQDSLQLAIYATDSLPLKSVIFISEILVFLFALLVGRHNILVIWFYLFAAANAATLLDGGFHWPWHLVLMPLILIFYMRLSKRLGLSIWRFSRPNSKFKS